MLLKRKRAGLSDPMSVVTRFVNACNRHDAEAVAACLHAEFDSIQPMYPARNFRGADQVRRNWQAIFDAEPGFRLTVLRQAAADDTVWLELHGAGEEAEVAGVFVMGIQGDRVRWARIYSALIEPLPPGYEQGASSPATLRQVPPLDATDGEAATEPAPDEDGHVAPVVGIEGGAGHSRRRRRSRPATTGDVAEFPADEGEVDSEGEDGVEDGALTTAALTTAALEAVGEPAAEAGGPATAEPSVPDETPGPEPDVAAGGAVAEPEPEVEAVVLVAPETAAADAPADDGAAADAGADAVADDEPDDEPDPASGSEAEAASGSEAGPVDAVEAAVEPEVVAAPEPAVAEEPEVVAAPEPAAVAEDMGGEAGSELDLLDVLVAEPEEPDERRPGRRLGFKRR